MANVVYNLFKKDILDGTTDLVNDTIKAMLVDSGYTADPDHDVVDDGVSAAGARPGQNELSGTGYTSGFAGSGRKTLASKTITEDDTNDRGKFTAANLTWSSIDAGTAARVVVYRHITDDSASTLVCSIDGGFPVTTNGGDLNVNWHTDGIFYLA